MSDTLNTDRLTRIIKTGAPEDCIAYLASCPPTARTRMAKTAVTLFKEWDKSRFETMLDGKHRTDVRPDVARVAVLATASLTQVKSCGWNICVPFELMKQICTEFEPDWLDAWVDHLLADNPFNFNRLHPLWDRGLCSKPQSDAYYLGMIVSPSHSLWSQKAAPDMEVEPQDHVRLPDRLRNRPDLHPDFWRFFEIEGNGEFSLAAFDKFVATEGTWAFALRELSDEGLIDRNRLLDASLDALARDFAQFRAGWYSRFYGSMDPTPEEQITRKDRFLQLLGSAIPPTVSFALKAIKQIDKVQPIAEAELLEAIPPVLQARQKGTVATGLGLIEAAAKRRPEIGAQALPVVLGALIHEAADIQTRALDLIEKLGIADHPKTREDLQGYIDSIAPSLRPRVTALSGAEAPVTQSAPTVEKRAPVNLDPIGGFDAFIAEFLHVLEDTGNPLRIEQVIDALARHGADRPFDFDNLVGPLAKRAAQILTSANDMNLRSALAHLAQCYAGHKPNDLPERMIFGSMVSLGWSHRKTSLGAQNFVTVFIKRNIDILSQVQRGLRLPLLCAPTDDRGFVATQTLIERILEYQAAAEPPSPYDLSLALLRLAPEGRDVAVKSLKPDSEITRALVFALGGERKIGKLNIGKTKWLWVAAAAARIPRTDDRRIAGIAGRAAPDIGVSAQYDVSISTRTYDKYVFPDISVKTSPAITKPLPDTFLPGLFHLTTAGTFCGSVCGHTADDIRWASLVWPQNPEPFFAQGVDVFDPDQRLSNSPYAAFIEPMLMPHMTLGSVGTLLLSQTLAGADPAVRSIATEALISCIEEERIDPDLFAQATLDLITKAALPVARWTRAFGEVAKISPRHASYLCKVITNAMRFDPSKPPRDIGGLVELLFELHVETKARLTNAQARACLGAVAPGGKLGKFSKRLLSM